MFLDEDGSLAHAEGLDILQVSHSTKELEKTAAKGPLDSAAAFAKFQEDQNKKKSDVNSAEQAQASVNYIKVSSLGNRISWIFMISKLPNG